MSEKNGAPNGASEEPILTSAQVDNLGRALITLSQELWTTKDRLQILEAILETHGVLADDAVDLYQPNDELAAKLNAARERYIQRILSDLSDIEVAIPSDE